MSLVSLDLLLKSELLLLELFRHFLGGGGSALLYAFVIGKLLPGFRILPSKLAHVATDTGFDIVKLVIRDRMAQLLGHEVAAVFTDTHMRPTQSEAAFKS